MEVHAHSHTPRKKWTHYFWEFLMLFLAVFCGFLAEYQLEHVIEHQREKQYMRSLVGDLNADTAQLSFYLNWRKKGNQEFDSLITLFSGKDINKNAFLIYKLAYDAERKWGFPDISERTIQQLKNSGSLRLIRNNTVSNAINKHYMEANRMKSLFEPEILARMKFLETRGDVLDALTITRITDTTMRPESFRLITTEPVTINHYLNSLLMTRYINARLIDKIELIKASSDSLRELIQKEYRIK